MRTNGWRGDPVELIKMPDGRLPSMDNTRVSAAREAGINVKANVRTFDMELAEDEIKRFSKGKKFRPHGVMPSSSASIARMVDLV
jgi:hypothetical protein